MKNKYHRNFRILTLILCLGGYQTVFAARPIEVTSATPGEAPQEMVLDVTIGGSGFDGTVDAVNFLVPCDPDPEAPPCNPADTGGVTTSDIRVLSSRELIVKVMIDKDATAVIRDVQVTASRGRGGKGTTLFRVQARNQEQNDPFTPVDIKVGFDGSAFEEKSPWYGPYSDEIRHPWTSENWTWATGGAFLFDNWDANDLSAVPRPCRYTTVGALAPSGGRYDCFESGSESWPHGGRVSIDLSGLDWVEAAPPRKGWKNPEFCELLSDPISWADYELGVPYLRFGVTRYQIYFMDGCDANACDISMRAMSYSGSFTGQPDSQLVQLHPFHDLNGYPDIGKFSVSAWAPQELTSIKLKPTAPGELNVFSVAQAIPIDRLSIQFASVKNGAIVATCEAAVDADELWLVTEPE